jgi:hypothetical protein
MTIKYPLRFLPLSFIVLVSCSPRSTQVVSTRLAETNQPTRQPTPLYVNTPSKTSIPTASIPIDFQTPTPERTVPSPGPTSGILEPEVVRVCPEQQEVLLGDLDLDPRLRLFVRELEPKKDASGAWFVSTSSPTPQVVPNTQEKEGWKLSGYGPSPSGQWLVLYFVGEGGTQNSIWLSSLDGSEQWKVITLDIGKWDYFITDDEMIVIDIPEEKQAMGKQRWDDYVPLFSINPFTGVKKTFPALPDGAVYDFYFAHENQSYAVYHLKGRSIEPYYLYNYTESSSTPVFQWLRSYEGWHYLNPGVGQRRNGLFVTTLDRSYGFDMAIDLSFEEISQCATYNDIMKPIFLPGGDSIDITTSTYVRATKNAFPVIRTIADVDEPHSLYMFDYSKNVLKDYCLRVISSGFISFSQDERFLATTLYYASENVSEEGTRDLVPEETMILDTETGHYARIKGFESAGWGMAGGDSP